jgi:hypothetical protein
MCQFSLTDKTNFIFELPGQSLIVIYYCQTQKKVNFEVTKFLPILGQVFYFGVAALAAIFRFVSFNLLNV